MPISNTLNLTTNPFLRFERKGTEPKESQDLSKTETKQLSTLTNQILEMAPHLNQVFTLKIGENSQKYNISRNREASKSEDFTDPLKGTTQVEVKLTAQGKKKNTEVPEEINFSYREEKNESTTALKLSYQYSDQMHRNIFWAKANPDKIMLTAKLN